MRNSTKNRRAGVMLDEKQKLPMTEYGVKTPLTYVI
nr:MAG TPA: hypothetical protein [Caudoviricetes sp.]